MTKTLEAIFDGKLRLAEPIELEPSTWVRITLEVEEVPKKKSVSFLKTAQSLNLDGPPDWSEKLDSYPYDELNLFA